MLVSKIIKCSANWCSPCRVFASTFEKVASKDEFKEIEFKPIDIESKEGIKLATQYNIKSIPTTILLDKNNNVIYKLIGNVSEQDFVNTINRANGIDE